MYQIARPRGFVQPAGMGFSLKPPAWVTNAVSNIIKQAVGGTTVTIQTDAGPQSFDITTAAGRAALQRMVASAKIGKPAPTPGPAEQANDFVNQIPGGWVTVVGGAVLLFLLLKRRG